MNNININNIFSSSNNDVTRPLDVYSLYHINQKKTHRHVNFSVDNLINERNERKKKVIGQYKKIFHMCLNKITTANKINKTNILYYVPNGIFRYPDYSTVDCLKYLEEKLQKLYMETYINSNESIFITWINIDENMKKAERYNKDIK